MHVCIQSRFSHVQLSATPGTVACQAPLSMEFSRQEYWSGFPFPPAGDLPHPGMEPASIVSCTDRQSSLPLAPPGKLYVIWSEISWKICLKIEEKSVKECEKFWLITSELRECLLPDGASLVAQVVKNLPAKEETWVHPWVRKIPWRSKWQLTPVFLPGKPPGQRSLAGYSRWGHTDTTEWLTLSLFFHLLLPHRWSRNTFLYSCH